MSEIAQKRQNSRESSQKNQSLGETVQKNLKKEKDEQSLVRYLTTRQNIFTSHINLAPNLIPKSNYQANLT